MWIDYIELKNFRQYQEDKIEFADPKEGKNINIIKGTTGAGKTNILNAVTWCFYGKEFHLAKETDYPMSNTLTLEELEPGERCTVEVQIQLRDESDRMIVTRVLDFGKTEDGKIRKMPSLTSNTPDGSEVRVLRTVKGKGLIDATDIAIETTIPKSLREYFFFDGERLDDYFREETSVSIKDAVFQISHLEKLDTTMDNLEKIESEFRKDAKGKLSNKAKEIEEGLRIREKSLKKSKEELETRKDEKSRAEQKEREYSEKLRGVDVKDVSELEEERRRLERKVEEDSKGRDTLDDNKSDYILNKAPSVLVFNVLSKTRELLKGKKESGEIPPDYKKNFIEKLLEEGSCICGTDISSENEHRKKVETVLKECDEITNISEELSDQNATLRGIQREITDDFKKELERYNREISKLENEIKGNGDRIEEISSKLMGVEVEKVRGLESKRREYEKIKNEIIEDIGSRKTRIEMEEKNIEDLKTRFEKELKQEHEGEKLRKRLVFCDKALKIAESIKEEIMEDMRKEIEKKTGEQFLQLIWKERNYDKVIINDEYDVAAIDQGGRDATGILSAGERQALALSFMAALSAVSGFEAPIIIDTPLGRIDEGKPKQQIAENLPNYFEGKQVIMFVTGSEYTPEVRERLLPKMGKEYEIKFEEFDIGNKACVVPYGK